MKVKTAKHLMGQSFEDLGLRGRVAGSSMERVGAIREELLVQTHLHQFRSSRRETAKSVAVERREESEG